MFDMRSAQRARSGSSAYSKAHASRDEESAGGGRRSSGSRFRERRRSQRYPLRIRLRYTICERGLHAGEGESCEISSKAVRFTADAPPPVGAMVELSLRWPLRLGDELPLRLVVFGPVYRRDAGSAVVLIKRYSFVRDAEAGGEDEGPAGEPPTPSAN